MTGCQVISILHTHPPDTPVLFVGVQIWVQGGMFIPGQMSGMSQLGRKRAGPMRPREGTLKLCGIGLWDTKTLWDWVVGWLRPFLGTILEMESLFELGAK